MTISEVLAGRLDDTGVTQELAAQALGVKQSVVSRWVAGKDTPSDRYVPAIVKFTGISERRVLDAIHKQRIESRTMPSRVAALEAEMAEVKSLLLELKDRLEAQQGTR